MIYTFSYTNPAHQYIDIEFKFQTKGESRIEVQLPAWRPGRYELGNFAKNIQCFEVFDEKGHPIKHQKKTKDLWVLEVNKAKEVNIKYNYYAAVLNAGSTYLDHKQMYVNPVNCCLYLPERMDESAQIVLQLPPDYEVATGLENKGQHQFEAKNFHELADCPFMASKALQRKSYKVGEHTFWIWFQGEIKPDWNKLINDFTAFTQAQMELFGDFPCPEYHFLFQILPQSAYHGVEHSNSTVIALGPSYHIMKKGKRYEDLLGVSSHELFHTWNIKRIRPVEMWPYDYSKENYSRLGYLAEGATTWYGDEQLCRSGVFDDKAYFKTVQQLLDRHFNNAGVLNLSVADSSFDTWLDGYELGVPNRKSSIYVEGALITFMLDVIIRENSKEQYSFDDVMRAFYKDFYQKGTGISEADYKATVEQFAKEDLTWFFEAYVNGSEDMTEQLKKAFSYRGWKWEQEPSDNHHEAYLGFRYLNDKVHSIYPNSPAHVSALAIGDGIQSINGYQINGDLEEWCAYFGEEEIELQAVDAYGNTKTIKLKAGGKVFYTKNLVRKN